ncbi:MAG TPA: hypothetical protein VIV65_11620 [Gemmatimonadaceae bacterium]
MSSSGKSIEAVISNATGSADGRSDAPRYDFLNRAEAFAALRQLVDAIEKLPE